MGTWNLWKWLDAVGIQREDQPALIHGVQPVVVLGDHSSHASPNLVPSAWMGAHIVAVAAVFPGAQLTSRSAGGTIVRELIANCGTVYVRFSLTQSPGTLANTQVSVRNDFGPSPTVSSVLCGTFAANPHGVTAAGIRAVGGANVVLSDGFYVPPGWTLQLSGSTANQVGIWAFSFEDLPAAVGKS